MVLAASEEMSFDPIWGGGGEGRRNAHRAKGIYLRDILQRCTGIDKLLLALIVTNFLSFLGDICGHLLDDGDTLRPDLLETLRQLKKKEGILSLSPFVHSEQRTAESL